MAQQSATRTNHLGGAPLDNRRAFLQISGDFLCIEEFITRLHASLISDYQCTSNMVVGFGKQLDQVEQQITENLDHHGTILKGVCERLETLEKKVEHELNLKTASATLQLIKDVHPDLDDEEFRQFNLQLYGDLIQQLGFKLILPTVNGGFDHLAMRPVGSVSDSDARVWIVTHTIKFGLQSDTKVWVPAEVRITPFNNPPSTGGAS